MGYDKKRRPYGRHYRYCTTTYRAAPAGPRQRYRGSHWPYPAYQAAPAFTYIIGDYTLDRSGVLSGPWNEQLLRYLAGDGYQTKQE